MRAIRVACAAALCLVAASCCTAPNPRQEAASLCARIETDYPSLGSQDASTVAGFRDSLDTSPLVQELVRLGAPGAEEATSRYSVAALKNADEALSAYAYVIEKTRFIGARKTLEDFLRAGPARSHYTWCPHFAVRALLVLKGLRDDTGGYARYSDADIARAVANP